MTLVNPVPGPRAEEQPAASFQFREPDKHLGRKRGAVTWLLGAAGVTTTLVATAAIVWLVFLPLRTANRVSTGLIEHTQEVIGALNRLLVSADDLETGERGFLLTQDEAYLQPYAQAAGQLEQHFSAARELIADNPGQVGRLRRLSDQIQARKTVLDRAIMVARSGDLRGALDVVRNGGGNVIMGNIRLSMAAMITEEQDLLQVRRNQALRADHQMTLVFVSLLGLAVCGVLLSAGLFIRAMVASAVKVRLRETTATHQRLLDMANVAPVMLRESDGTILLWSEGCRRLYGWTTEEAVGRLSHELLRTILPQPLDDIEAALLHSGLWSGELLNQTRDGAEIVVSARMSLHHYADRSQAVVVETTIDKTALHEVQIELRRSEAKLSSLVETAADGFVIAKADGQIASVNPAVLRMFGYERADELIGRNLKVLMPAAEAIWQDDGSAADRSGGAPGCELLAARRDGSEFPIDLSLSSFGPKDSRSLTGIIRDETARKRAEATLRDSERRLSDLLLTLGLGTFMARDLDGTIRYWSEGCERLYGWRAEEAVGQSAHGLLGTIFPVPLADVEAILERVGEWNGDLLHHTKDGRSITVTAHKRLRRSENGGDGVVMEALTDVTAARAAEAAVRESEARFRLMADNMSQLAWIADETGSMSWFNKRWHEYTGTTLEEMQGSGWQAVHHPDHVARVIQRIRHAFETGEPWEDTFPLRGKDGQYRSFLSRALPERDAQGRIVRWFGTNTDVTEQLAAEQVLADSRVLLEDLVTTRTASLTTLEARFRGIFNSQSQFISLIALDGTVLEMNRAASEGTASIAPPAFGQSLGDNTRWSAAEGDRLRQDFDAVLRGASIQREVAIKGVDGQNVWVALSLTPVRDATADAVVSVIAEMRDLTEMRDLAAQLAQAQKMQALGQLAGGIAHDFNNILQAVSGAARLIDRQAEDRDKSRHFARMVIAAADRGASITQRLLSFARRGELHADAIETAELLHSVSEVLAHTLGTTITVDAIIEPDLPALFADQAQLETAIINLGTNARDAMPDGGTLTLSAAAEHVGEGSHHPAGLVPGDYVRLTIADTGLGMDKATLARVCEPFFTTKPPGQGTGLGVSMVKGFAEQSGGGFSIDSIQGEGTTVAVWLRQADGAVARASDDQSGAQIVAGSSARILVVDDDDLVREMVASQLEADGFATLVAASGAEALALLASGEVVDAMVSDLSMPGMNGLVTIQKARALRPRLPCFLLTGYAGERAALSGADSFTLVRKPVSGRSLTAQIEARLESARQ